MPKAQQAIIWTDDDTVHRRMYEPRGLNELKQNEHKYFLFVLSTITPVVYIIGGP